MFSLNEIIWNNVYSTLLMLSISKYIFRHISEEWQLFSKCEKKLQNVYTICKMYTYTKYMYKWSSVWSLVFYSQR